MQIVSQSADANGLRVTGIINVALNNGENDEHLTINVHLKRPRYLNIRLLDK